MKLVTLELEAIEDSALTDYADQVAKMIREVKPKVAAMEVALIKIAAKRHGDRSISLEAQGYDEIQVAVIGAEDYLANIAYEALQNL